MLHPNDAKSSILCFEIVDLDALSLQVTSLSCSVGNGLALERNNLRHQIYILRPSRAVEYWTVLSTARCAQEVKMSSEAQPASNIELQAQHTQQPDPQGSSRVPPSIWEDLDAQEAALDAEMAELSSLIEAQDNEFKELSRRAEELNMGVLKNARRELGMRWRKKLLHLPMDHVWTRSDWESFAKLGKAVVAADLGVAPDAVEKLFRHGQHEILVGGPLDVTESEIVEAMLATRDELDFVMLCAMYEKVFGKPADGDLAVRMHSVFNL